MLNLLLQVGKGGLLPIPPESAFGCNIRWVVSGWTWLWGPWRRSSLQFLPLHPNILLVGHTHFFPQFKSRTITLTRLWVLSTRIGGALVPQTSGDSRGASEHRVGRGEARQAINAGSQLVRSECGQTVSKGLSATQTLNFQGYWVTSEFNLLTANKASLKVSSTASRTQAQSPLFLGCVISLNHCAPIS